MCFGGSISARRTAAPGDAGSERLGAGFLGSKSLGISFGSPHSFTGFPDFTLGKAALLETFTKPVERPSDPFNITEVIANSDNHARA